MNDRNTVVAFSSFNFFIQCYDKSIPLHMQKMGAYLQWIILAKRSRAVLLAFRYSGKSTLVGMLGAWLLFRNPQTRILILSAESRLAKRLLRHIQNIITNHPLCEYLVPEKGTKKEWGGDKFSVKRIGVLKDPSVVATGIFANVTGIRADIVLCDDVEVPNTVSNPSKREKLMDRLVELEFILGGQGLLLFIGTPHCLNSIYNTEQK
ncbi:MAG: phage terminase large subunit [Alphaproteobacteria bacterium]|nr:phage terminase large subunit [Alphaproteobacteria bacterium]MBL0718140.1 phage terminase large subunit [Alphaproteobacteria bacterium]